MTDDTLYEKLGGEEAIHAVVDRFYERVLADDRLAGFFDDTDVQELRAHQAAFLTYVTGGTDEWEGRTMREAHAGLGITDDDFDAVAVHLQETLAEFDVPEEHVETVMTAVADLRGEVVAD